jgi:hypothetical protein
MMRYLPRPRRRQFAICNRRFGATLVEVLMALLIMGLGAVSVFTLFPISLLRSVHATQLTNSKIHKRNAEELLATGQALFYTSGVGQGAGGARYRGAWRPNTTYQPGDICIPTARPGSPVPVPNRWYVCTSTVPVASDVLEPQWNMTGPTLDNTDSMSNQLIWQPLPVIQIQIDPAFLTTYGDPIDPAAWDPNTIHPFVATHQFVVDPLGWNVAFAELSSVGPPATYPINEFGNKTDSTTGLGASLWAPLGGAADRPLLRINGGILGEFGAMQAASLPDTWESLVEATPVAFNAVSVEFAPTVDLSGVDQTLTLLRTRLLNSPPGTPLTILPPRIVLTSADGTLTETRLLDVSQVPSTGPNGGRVMQWVPNNPLPSAFLLRDIGQARIEAFDRRYSWIMTVRKPAIEWDLDGDPTTSNPLTEDGNVNNQYDLGDPNSIEIKLAVIFKRAFAAQDEHVYDANFANAAVDLEGDGTADGPQHALGTAPNARADWVKIMWNPNGTGPLPQNEPNPIYRAGNFLFDARDVTWYRIQEVYEEGTANGRNYAVLILDRTPRLQTPADTNTPPGAFPAGRVILMRGIVELFDL